MAENNFNIIYNFYKLFRVDKDSRNELPKRKKETQGLILKSEISDQVNNLSPPQSVQVNNLPSDYISYL